MRPPSVWMTAAAASSSYSGLHANAQAALAVPRPTGRGVPRLLPSSRLRGKGTAPRAAASAASAAIATTASSLSSSTGSSTPCPRVYPAPSVATASRRPGMRCRATTPDPDSEGSPEVDVKLEMASGAGAVAGAAAAGVAYTQRPVTPSEAWRRMWTRADKFHVHAVSGAAFTLVGIGLAAAWAKRDVDALTGGTGGTEAIDAALAAGGTPEWWPVAVASLACAGVCAASGLPLGRARGWRKTELSARSALFQVVLTWQALRLGPSGESLAWFDDHIWQLSLAPFVWQTMTSVYIILATKDDRRSAAVILIATWLFGAQV